MKGTMKLFASDLFAPHTLCLTSRSSFWGAIFTFFFLLLATSAQATVRYVKTDGNDSNTGLSWGQAYLTVQKALETAVSGDEIWVKAGTYKPTKEFDGTTDASRDFTFYLKDGVAVYGGFAGTENLLSQRNWTSNVTILSGDIGTVNDNSDNCHHVVLSVSDASTTKLDGFTVTKGNADGSGSFSVETKNILRTQGGGMYNHTTSATVANCIFDNLSGNNSGGMYNTATTGVTVTACVFSGNTSTSISTASGAVMNNVSAVVTFTNCSFSGNSGNTAGAMLNTGSVNAVVTNCTFSGNSSPGSAGAMVNQSSSNAVVTNCLFFGNYGVNGAFYNNSSSPTLTNCTITGNSTLNLSSAGGLTNSSSTPTLKNCLIWNNRVDVTTGSAAANMVNISSTPVISYSLIQNWNPSGTGNLNGITNAANSNYPSFVTPLDPATTPSTSGDFHVTNCSPVLNLGDNTGAPTTDLFGNSRPFATTVDLGVHELQAAATCPTPGTIWFVDAAGTACNSGTSWVCAFQNLQDAINAASSGHEIWVKAGTYFPTKDPFGNASPTDPRDKTFYLKDGVKVYGGFAGTETLRTQRNWTTNPTTLSGDLGTVGSTTDNAYHVVLSVSDAAATELDGFRIEKGNATAPSSITVETKAITRIFGGGMFNTISSPTISNCVFSENNTDNFGGGMYNSPSSSPSILNCTFLNNTAVEDGGGMFNYSNSNPTLTNCIFSANVAGSYGGGMINSVTSNPILTNCLFTGNDANVGGGMRNHSSSPSLTNCVFSGNKAVLWGGGMANSVTSDVVLKNCIIWNNRASTTTGSLDANFYTFSSTPVISYSLIQSHNPAGTGNLNGIPNAATSNYPSFTTPLDPATAPSTSGDFHITNCSPVLNLGTNTGAPATDLFGNSRPFATTVDLGVHELQAAAAAVPTITCPANQTGTNPYTLADFTSLASATGTCTPISVSQSPAIGTSLAIGMHTITLTATASNGATATCTFTVTVNSSCPATGTVWFVNPAAASGGNGASWACGFQNVQDAINAASSGHEIWVKAGTYLPTKEPDGTTDSPRDFTFYLKNGVAVYGGFAGTETLRSQRNWTSNPTILSGDIGTSGNTTDDCYHVLLSVSDASTTVLDGFTVTKGNANGAIGTITVETKTISRTDGGGMNNNSSSPTIANCTFSANLGESGGGIYNIASSPAVSNCTFSNNTTSNIGGAMTNVFTSNPTLTNCTFSSNSATNYGGAMENNTSDPILTNCIFTGNSSTYGGAMDNYSGADVTLTNCSFSGNSASAVGGGMYNLSASPTMTNCTFSGNKATTSGGAMQNITCSPTLKNCLIWNNRVGSTTGSADASMTNSNANPTITYSLIQNWNPSGTGNLNGIPNAATANYPNFVTPLDPATAPATSGDFHIQTCSPAVNKGTNTGAPTTDLFGNTRPYNSGVADMGVHELQAAQPTPTITCPANQTGTTPYTLADFTSITTASGGCGIVSLSQSPAIGTNLAVGMHTITMTATDALGTTATCAFTVTVNSNCPATSTIWYVNPSAASGGNGASWACGFQNVQDAINAASSGHEVWVKTGTYFPTKDPSGNASPADPRDKTFYMKNGVAVYGGFAGTETLRSQRNWTTNPTILSADLGTANDLADNAYHVVLSISDANTTVLDGFTIEKGNANGSGSISVEFGTVFRTSGGGLRGSSTAMLVSNCQFSGNDGGSGSGGGGGFLGGSSTAAFTNCQFLNNSVATSGGGMLVSTCSPTFTDCMFSGNSAGSGGGGLYVANSGANPVITRCIFSGNTSTSFGGGIMNYNGAPTLTNCIFLGNKAGEGGGMHNIHASANPQLFNCTFSGNHATASGGAFYNSIGTATLTNCLIWNNREGTTNGSASASLLVNSGTVNILYSLLQNQNPSGTGNLNGIPNAANSNYPNFVTPLDPITAPSTSGDFHIGNCSPAINSGTNTGAPATDLFGNARPFGTTVDMGVHELQSAPTPVVATCQNVTVNLDGAGNGTLAASSLNNGSTGCATLSFSASQTAFSCANLGANTVTLTVTGANGSTGSCNATVTVADQLAPNALCRDFVKNLGINGTASITMAEVNNLSNDNCGTVNLVSVSPNSFTCSNIGANTVTLTVNDGHGNVSSCNASVTVADATPPTATCQNISVNLNSGGTASITAAQVNNGSTDNCGVATTTVLPNSFGCANVGPQTVTLTVTDVNSLSSTCSAVVTVSDATNPTAICQNFAVNLNSGGTASVTAAQVNNGSSDNCGIAALSVLPSTFACANVGANTVTLTVTDNSGRTATCTATVTVADVTNPSAVCQPVTVNLDGNGTASVSGAQVDGGSTDNCGIASRSVTPNTFTTANIGANTVTLTVTDNNARTATCTAIVTVTNTNLPNAVCQPYTAVLNSSGTASITAANVDGGSTAVGGIDSRSVSPNSFTCSNLGTNTVILTVTGNNGLSSTCNAIVTVQDNTSPTAVCQNIAVNLSGSTSSITAAQILNAASSSDNCGTVNAVSVLPNSFNCNSLGANTVTLTANDGHGNTATCTAVVTVSDATAPTALCQNIAVNLNAIGTVSVGAAQVNNASTDNCGSVNLVSVVPSTFTCVNIGQNTVTLTVNDGHGNTATCLAIVSVADNLAPSALCCDIVAQLDGSGNSTITAAQVNNGSSDNCALGILTVSPSTFTLANLGINTVTLTVSDANSNSATCTAVVTVENNQLPNAVCQNIARSNGSNGTVVLTAAEVDGGSTALGGIASSSVLPNTLNCSNLGAATVVLTIVGNNGQQASCNATITVSDNLAPTAVCQNIAVNLSGSTANITAAQVLNVASSSDNCGTVNAVSVLPNSFNCTNLGANTVTLTANDGHGNTATCTAVVTVSDATAPTAVCQNIAVNLSGSTANITAAQILNVASSSDNCGTINTQSLSPNVFTCSNLGANTVTLTANDGHGNTATCTAVVTVSDATAPTVVCQNIAVNLSGSTANITAAQILNAASSSDNCGMVNASSVLPNSFNCTNLGANTVTLTANDGHGNTATCTAVVTVSDATAPTALCQNISVNLNAIGTVSVGAAQVNNASTDNCGSVNLVSVVPSTFTCVNLGQNTVTLTVNDGQGNTATCLAIVSVADNLAPSALCRDIVAQLDGNGTVTITAAQVNNGSSDNCALGTLTVSPNTFTLANLGINTVTLTVPDANSNSATCTAVVTVGNNQLPNAVCQNIARSLGSNGTVVLTAAEVDGGSTALGGIASSSVLPNTLNCSNLGASTVVLTIVGNNGQQASCNATVTVSDNLAPTAVCQNISVNLSGSTANITAAQILNAASSSDNCGTVNASSVSPNSFNCTNLGANTVTLTANDGHGNTATCTAVVTVSDATTPTAVCQNIAVNLSGSTANITAAQILNVASSSDNCGTVNASSVSPNSFNCTNLGANTVTLTANDGHGNTASCTAVVTVSDATAPIPVCQNIAVNLSGSTANITAAQILNIASSSDNCGTVNASSVLPNSFNCTNLGANTVTLTANDGHGNTATCTAVVTVSDATAPTAVCQNIAVNLSGSTVNITAAQILNVASSNDNCGTVNAQGVTTNTFTCSNLGANTVTLTVNDGRGNTATCTAIVTVSDATAPTLVCQNVSVNLSGNSANVTAAQVFNGGSSSDNCGTVNLVGVSPNSFTCTNLGANTVTLTANDGRGNTATCTAIVTVQAAEINLRGNGMDILDGDATPSTADHTDFGQTSGSPIVRTFTVQNTSVVALPVSGITIGGANPGQFSVGPLTPASPVAANGSATFTVTYAPNAAAVHNATVNIANGDCDEAIYDFAVRGELTCTAPTFTACPSTPLTAPAANGLCSAALAYSVIATGIPSPALTYAFTGATTGTGSGTGTGASFNTGSTTVTVTATNPCGMPTCTFTVTVSDTQNPSITCPGNMSKNTDSNQCTAVTTYTSPSFSDNCAGAFITRTSGPASGSAFPIGTTMVEWKATDVGGNSSTCSFVVNVLDAQAPNITCPANIVRSTDLGQCNAVVTYVTPTATDNCTTAIVAIVSSSLNSGSVFSKGVSTVVWKATDTAGNTQTCAFTVTVNDTQKPTITCPANKTQSTSPNLCSALVSYTTPTATDNCTPNATVVPVSGGTGTIQGVPNSSATFDKGMNTVIWKATDAAGNTQTCSFRVTVNDTEAPTMTCPAAISLSTVTNTCSAVATYTNPSFTDNCAPTTGVATRVSGLVSGSTFPVGNSNVVFQATDAAGNTRRCTMVVTVTDNQLPVITCPAPVIVTGSGTPCKAVVFYGSTTASDNCAGTLTPFLFTGLSSGSQFPAGVTTNTFRAVAPNGQSSECSFTVTVDCGSVIMGYIGVEVRDEDLSVQHSDKLDLKLAPNPALSTVTVSIEGVGAGGGTLLVFDAVGRLVLRQVVAENQRTAVFQVDGLEFAPGLYRVNLRTERGMVTKTLVVVKD